MKNSETLFAALSDVADGFVPTMKPSSRAVVQRIAAVAAAAAVLIGGLYLGGVFSPRRMTLEKALTVYPLYAPFWVTPHTGSEEIVPAGRQGEGGVRGKQLFLFRDDGN